MRKPYMMPVFKAMPDVKISALRISKLFGFAIRFAARLCLFAFYRTAKVVLRGGDELFGVFKRGVRGKTVVSLFSAIHAACFIMPKFGTLPIHHSKVDRQGMSRICEAVVNGNYPVALAPNGQVSYTMDSVPRLEKGIMRIGFFSAERLLSQTKFSNKNRSASSESVPLEILPLAIHARYGKASRRSMERLLRKIEKYSGLSGTASSGGNFFPKRLDAVRNYIPAENEKRYGIRPEGQLTFAERLDAVIDAALKCTENILGVESKGGLFDRMYFLRQIAWDRIVLSGVTDLKKLSKVTRAIKDLAAGEAWHASRHLEVVDLGWYFRGPLSDDDALLHRKVEYVQNLWDFANRTMGGAFNTRSVIFARRIILQATPAINLTKRLEDYKKDKKAAVDIALSDLEKSFLHCIDEANRTEP